MTTAQTRVKSLRAVSTGSARDQALLAYEIVAFRRMQYDALMWQVPALSLTAQAFLLTISFGPDSSSAARLAASLLAVLTAVISVQLLAKHRRHESIDSHWLERFEEDNGLPPVHCPPWKRAAELEMKDASWLVSRPSYALWRAGLGIFGVVALVACALTLLSPESLSG